MGAPGTSYWTGSVLVFNTSSGGMSVYLDDETGAVSFGSYLGKHCSTNTARDIFLWSLLDLSHSEGLRRKVNTSEVYYEVAAVPRLRERTCTWSTHRMLFGVPHRSPVWTPSLRVSVTAAYLSSSIKEDSFDASEAAAVALQRGAYVERKAGGKCTNESAKGLWCLSSNPRKSCILQEKNGKKKSFVSALLFFWMWNRMLTRTCCFFNAFLESFF